MRDVRRAAGRGSRLDRAAPHLRRPVLLDPAGAPGPPRQRNALPLIRRPSGQNCPTTSMITTSAGVAGWAGAVAVAGWAGVACTRAMARAPMFWPLRAVTADRTFWAGIS